MLKPVLIFCVNVASIVAVITTLHETPESYIEWKIEKFLDLPAESGYYLNSPKFSLGSTKWSIQIYTNGSETDNSINYISLFLNLLDSKDELNVKFKLGLKRADGSESPEFEHRRTFNKFSHSVGWEKISRSELLDMKDTFLPEGNLTVFCKARILKSIEVAPEIISSGIDALSDNLKDLYTSRSFTDVTLIVENREFFAHKNVLSCRLDAFGTMLENIPDKIEITDCDSETFEEFLLFVYTGKLVDVASKKAMSIYQTAAKYNLTELKKECSRLIVENEFSIDSFSDILRFAILHNDDILLMSASIFFYSNVKQILLNENWRKFLTQYPLQGNELFLKYTEKKIIS